MAEVRFLVGEAAPQDLLQFIDRPDLDKFIEKTKVGAAA